MNKDKTSREKILLTACRLFAKKGFKGTTIRELCKEADTYQISINYYFQSKENLFLEAVVKSYELSSLEKINQQANQLTAEEIIDKGIRAKMNSFFDNSPENWFFQILTKAFQEQIELSEEVWNKTAKKHEKIFKEKLKEISPNTVSEDDIDFSFFLLISQMFTITFHPLINKEFIKCCEPDSKEIEWLMSKMKKSLMDSLSK